PPRSAQRNSGDKTPTVGHQSHSAYGVQAVRPREALQHHVPGRVEPNVAGALRQFAHQGRYQNLSTGCRSCDARSEADALAVEVVALAYGLASVWPDPTAARPVGRLGAVAC